MALLGCAMIVCVLPIDDSERSSVDHLLAVEWFVPSRNHVVKSRHLKPSIRARPVTQPLVKELRNCDQIKRATQRNYQAGSMWTGWIIITSLRTHHRWMVSKVIFPQMASIQGSQIDVKVMQRMRKQAKEVRWNHWAICVQWKSEIETGFRWVTLVDNTRHLQPLLICFNHFWRADLQSMFKKFRLHEIDMQSHSGGFGKNSAKLEPVWFWQHPLSNLITLW